MARTRVAFQCVTDAKITINEFYGRNSHFLCFGENLSQSLMEKNVKFVLNEEKATYSLLRFKGAQYKSADSSVTL